MEPNEEDAEAGGGVDAAGETAFDEGSTIGVETAGCDVVTVACEVVAGDAPSCAAANCTSSDDETIRILSCIG